MGRHGPFLGITAGTFFLALGTYFLLASVYEWPPTGWKRKKKIPESDCLGLAVRHGALEPKAGESCYGYDDGYCIEGVYDISGGCVPTRNVYSIGMVLWFIGFFGILLSVVLLALPQIPRNEIVVFGGSYLDPE